MSNMKSKLSLTVIYIVLIIYFKVKLPEYTVQELEHDLKITLYACYSDTLVPLWKHFLYDIDNSIRKGEINHRVNSASRGEEIPKKKESNDNLGSNTQTTLSNSHSCLDHFDSWKIQEDLRIHPIGDPGPSTSSLNCNKHPITKTKKKYNE